MIAHIDPDTEHRAARVVPARPVGRHPGHGHTRRSTPRSTPDRSWSIETIENELRRPDQPLPRGRLRRLPQHRRRDRHGPDLLPDAGARHEDRARHPEAGCQHLDGARRSRTCGRATTSRSTNGKWHEDPTLRPRPHPAPAVLPPLARQRGGASRRPRNREKVERPHRQDASKACTRDPHARALDILALAKTFRSVEPGGVEMVTLPSEPALLRRRGRARPRPRRRPRRSSHRLRGVRRRGRRHVPEGVDPGRRRTSRC